MILCYSQALQCTLPTQDLPKPDYHLLGQLQVIRDVLCWVLLTYVSYLPIWKAVDFIYWSWVSEFGILKEHTWWYCH